MAKAGGNAAYMTGLLVTAAVLAIAVVPLGIELLGWIFAIPIHISPGAIAFVVALTVLAPLGAGLLVRQLAPAFAERIATPVSWTGTIALVAGVLPIFVVSAPAILSLIGNGTLLAIAAFVLVGVAAGHLLGGPDPANRTVLALVTASRHPGVALTIASANFHDQKVVIAALLLYLIVNVLVSLPYQILRQRGAKATTTVSV